MSENFDALFNISADTLIKEETKSNSDLYRPKAEDGKDNVYKSVIRFVPWHKDPSYKSIIRKWVVWLTNPNIDESKMVDCPSTINEKSILQDTFFKLYKSPSVQDQQLAKNFSRREQFFSLVYIIKDENNPELEGKIKIFRYGKKIYDKLEGIIKHPEEPNMPFDAFLGRPLMLHITKQSGFNNYDNSNFLSKPYPIPVNGKALPNDPKSFPIIFKFLEENSPDLEQYAYRPWTDEIKQFVLGAINAILPAGKIKQSILKTNAAVTTNKPIQNKRPPKDNVQEKINNLETQEEIPSNDIDIDIKDDVIDDFVNKSGDVEEDDPFSDLDLGDDDDIYSNLGSD